MADRLPTRRRAETQARLLDAAMGTFADRGVLAATVEEICDRAGFSRGAFYSNFASKDQLVMALFRRDAQTSARTLVRLTADEVRAGLNGSRTQMVAEAVQLFLALQPTERTFVVGLAEMRLYALRQPAIRDAYRSYLAANHREMLTAMRTVQAAYGLVFSTPPESVIDVIDASYEAAVLQAMLLPEADHVTDLKQLSPAMQRTVMMPLIDFLESWIVDVGVFPAGGSPDAAPPGLVSLG